MFKQLCTEKSRLSLRAVNAYTSTSISFFTNLLNKYLPQVCSFEVRNYTMTKCLI